MKKLVVFDPDGTLAESKSPHRRRDECAARARLLGVARVAVISGGDWPQFQKQLLASLRPAGGSPGCRCSPTCGGEVLRLPRVVGNRCTPKIWGDAEKQKITDSLHKAVAASGVPVGRIYGQQVEDRGHADHVLGPRSGRARRRQEGVGPVVRKTPAGQGPFSTRVLGDFSVRLGGTTSIDRHPARHRQGLRPWQAPRHARRQRSTK